MADRHDKAFTTELEIGPKKMHRIKSNQVFKNTKVIQNDLEQARLVALDRKSMKVYVKPIRISIRGYSIIFSLSVKTADYKLADQVILNLMHTVTVLLLSTVV